MIVPCVLALRGRPAAEARVLHVAAHVARPGHRRKDLQRAIRRVRQETHAHRVDVSDGGVACAAGSDPRHRGPRVAEHQRSVEFGAALARDREADLVRRRRRRAVEGDGGARHRRAASGGVAREGVDAVRLLDDGAAHRRQRDRARLAHRAAAGTRRCDGTGCVGDHHPGAVERRRRRRVGGGVDDELDDARRREALVEGAGSALRPRRRRRRGAGVPDDGRLQDAADEVVGGDVLQRHGDRATGQPRKVDDAGAGGGQ